MISRRAFVLLPPAAGVSFLGLAAAGCGGTTGRLPRSMPHPLAGMPAPDFQAHSAVSTDIVAVPGPADTTVVTVVDFWASWCGACIDSMPALERLYRRNRDRGVDVVGVSVDDEPRNALGTVMALQTTFPVVIDQHGRLQGAYAVGKIPTTFVIDRNGMVRWVGRDPRVVEEAVERLVAISG
jgi:cytochrome c biogenesis protein CcmG, thiol:disulfide interchange protein DsbE